MGSERVGRLVALGYEVPMMRKVLALLGCISIGCTTAGTPIAAPESSEGSVTAAEPAAPGAARPVDTSLAAVSRSAPSDDARDALSLCGVDPASGQIAGMALVPSGAEVGKYAPMFGTEPELKTDRPVWVIQLKGEVFDRTGMLVDPTCVVVDGVPTTYITHGAIDNGKRWTPPPVENPPTLALPPLAP